MSHRLAQLCAEPSVCVLFPVMGHLSDLHFSVRQRNVLPAASDGPSIPQGYLFICSMAFSVAHVAAPDVNEPQWVM